ncbi:hypervirulence associated TUDOR domain-containing protein [Kaistella palustris]|uniref:DUF2945 domain-containing protein n=1 Tax=Kaistella palustris TaxID=493376 RepID=UPI0004153ED9|nr:DUF2945 domain-containing protein [Kaistella palustris]
MAAELKIGDEVTWNSQFGLITGKSVKKHTADFEFMGRQRRASADDPQYEVQSFKTGKLAAHKPSALKKSGGSA